MRRRKTRTPKDKDNHGWFHAYMFLDHARLNQLEQAHALRISLHHLAKLVSGWKRRGLIKMVEGIPHLHLTRVVAEFPNFGELLYINIGLMEDLRSPETRHREMQRAARQSAQYNAEKMKRWRQE